jgi:hypothetical protein
MSRAGAEIMWAHVVHLNAGSDAAGLEFLQLHCDDSIVRLLTITRGSCLVEWPSAKREWYERRHLRLPAGQGAAELAFDVARLAGWFETMASGLAHGSSNGHALHRKAQAVPAPPLLSAAFTSQGPRQLPFGPAFGPQREAPRRVQTGKRLARDAGAILGERVVLGLRDDDELLEYVSRGREARQRQRLATADQATEREKRVALAHRQACTLPTYPANLPCQPTLRLSCPAHTPHMLAACHPPRQPCALCARASAAALTRGGSTARRRRRCGRQCCARPCGYSVHGR